MTHRSNADESDKGPVFERLSASRQYVHEILSQIKSEFDLEECTFHPAINPASENMARYREEFIFDIFESSMF